MEQIGTECLSLVPDPCQGKPGSQMDICFMDGKDIQLPCHCHQCQEIIIFIHSLIRDKFFVPFADPVIGSIVFKNVSGKDWLCFVSGDSGRGDRVGSFNVAVAMIHGNDFCVSDFSHKNPSCFCIDFLSSSYLRSTGLLWDKHTKIRKGRH